MTTGSGSKTNGDRPVPVLSMVRIAKKYAADEKKIQWAAAVALEELRDLVRKDWPGWTVPAASIELVSVDLEMMRGHAVFLFRGTPQAIPTKRKLRRR